MPLNWNYLSKANGLDISISKHASRISHGTTLNSPALFMCSWTSLIMLEIIKKCSRVNGWKSSWSSNRMWNACSETPYLKLANHVIVKKSTFLQIWRLCTCFLLKAMDSTRSSVRPNQEIQRYQRESCGNQMRTERDDFYSSMIAFKVPACCKGAESILLPWAPNFSPRWVTQIQIFQNKEMPTEPSPVS